MLKIKSVHEPIRKDDGLRILATRFRGRRMRSTRYNVWMACLGPTQRLLNWRRAHPSNTREWKKRYRDQMLGVGVKEPKNPVIRDAGQKFTLRLIKHLAKRQNVTLMCHCSKDYKGCHRFLLHDLMSAKI